MAHTGDLTHGRRGITVPEPIKARILELCRQGVTRNEIARQVGVSTSSVSGIVQRAGLSFDTSGIKAATEARQTRLRAARASTAEKLLTKANELLDEIDEPFLAFNIGGKDNIYTEHELEHAPTVDKKNLVQAASTALGRHLDLERYDTDEGARDAQAMLARLGEALGVHPPDDPA